MFNQQLFDIYTYCSRNDLIRALITYSDGESKGDRVSYHLVIFATDVKYFLLNAKWIEELGSVLHSEQDYSFKQELSWLRCCAVFEAGWSLQVWVLSTKESFEYIKKQQVQLLIDKDFRFKSEVIRLEAIKYNQWYDLPGEIELREEEEKFYTAILKSARLLSQKKYSHVIDFESRVLEPFLINLIQWISYCGEFFWIHEMGNIKKLVREVTADLPLIQTTTKWERLSFYVKTSEELSVIFSNIMNYQVISPKTAQLKAFFEILRSHAQNTDLGDKKNLIC